MQNSPTFACGSLTRLLATHNPFYLLSALLVLVGLHEALSGDSSLTGGWLLMGVLSGYTLLLVAAGYVIIRFGQVWEDARMLLLVIVLMFLALSVSFDKIVLENPSSGARFLLLGLAFSVLASEIVFWSLGIRLAARYRAPYYLVLTLLFLYPLGLAQLSKSGWDIAMTWGVFLFPVAASAVLLTLWPAARSRGEDEPDNGTPWPWFPWTLFAFLLLAIALRSYSLSMAFEATKGLDVSFKPYFLSPLLLSTALLLLEMGLVNGSGRTRGVALLLPIGALLMAFPGLEPNSIAGHFLARLIDTAGSPLQLALLGLGLFYAFAWLRGLRSGEIGLIVCVALASVVDEGTVDADSFTALQSLPLAAVAALELPFGLLRRSSWRVLVGSASCLSSIGVHDWSIDITPYSAYILWHSGAVALLVLGAIYDDRWARLFRRVALPVIPAAAIVAATGYEFLFPETPRFEHAVYLAGLCAVAFLYWRRSPGMPQLFVVLTTAGSLLFLGSRGLYLQLQSSPLQKGLPWLTGGLAAFALALLMSLIKGSLMSGGWRALFVARKE